MIYTQDITGGLEEAIGRDGAGNAEFSEALARANAAVAKLGAQKRDNSLPLLNVAERRDDIALIEATAKRIGGFEHFVVIGMGGSSYGGKALCALTENAFAPRPRTQIHFIDNIDPHTSHHLLTSLDVSATMFAVVSKSGDTAETLAQALILIAEIEAKCGKGAAHEHFIAITEPRDSALRRLATLHGMTVLDHDPGIGGRFSVLTHVGLLPAQVAGVDIQAVRKGAANVVRHTFAAADSEPARGAALVYALMRRGRSLSVMMPYCDRLDAFNVWYCQLWAESLGKDGKGSTPVSSIGVCDQHSQLQLYLGGPRDKLISLILLEQQGKGPPLPEITDPSLSYLRSKTLGDLMDAEQRATHQTLIRNHCPVRAFSLKRLDAEAMGALMMHFMLETMIMGTLLGINTFDQPAVEEGKVLAREYLGKK